MAIGLLGAASVSAPSTGPVGSAVVYTVPAGISHAVVHITLSLGVAQEGGGGQQSLSWVIVANSGNTKSAKVLAGELVTIFPASGTKFFASPSPVSMMLSPGDTVTVVASFNGSIGGISDCSVTGYEVP